MGIELARNLKIRPANDSMRDIGGMLKQMTPHKNLMFRNLIADYFTHVFKRGKQTSSAGMRPA